MTKIVYYVISIYNNYDGEYYDYETFENKKDAKVFLKENYKNPKAKVRKQVLKLR